MLVVQVEWWEDPDKPLDMDQIKEVLAEKGKLGDIPFDLVDEDGDALWDDTLVKVKPLEPLLPVLERVRAGRSSWDSDDDSDGSSSSDEGVDGSNEDVCYFVARSDGEWAEVCVHHTATDLELTNFSSLQVWQRRIGMKLKIPNHSSVLCLIDRKVPLRQLVDAVAHASNVNGKELCVIYDSEWLADLKKTGFDYSFERQQKVFMYPNEKSESKLLSKLPPGDGEIVYAL